MGDDRGDTDRDSIIEIVGFIGLVAVLIGIYWLFIYLMV